MRAVGFFIKTNIMQTIGQDLIAQWGAIGIIIIGLGFAVRYLIKKQEAMLSQMRSDAQGREEIIMQLYAENKIDRDMSWKNLQEIVHETTVSIDKNTSAIESLTNTIKLKREL